MKINIKPLSVNEAYRGRRFKTSKYKAYKKELLWLLPNLDIPDCELFLKMKVGFSSKASDLDNVIKNFLDVLQAKYGFNDNKIYKIEIEKDIVKKGEEYISFSIEEFI